MADLGEMVTTYLNQQERSKVLMLVALMAVIEEVEERTKLAQAFGKGLGDLRRAKAFVRRALERLADAIGEEQSKKIWSMAKHHDVAVIGRAAPRGQSEAIVEVDKLYDLAEVAIGDHHCTDCTITDHKGCRLYQVLSALDIPPADTVTTAGCPYRQ